jgi:hypothetical protein
MEGKQLNERCEICLNFKPDDKSKHILKNLSSKNPGNQQNYEQVANLMGRDPNASSDMGYCYVLKKSVEDTYHCDDFLHDISKNY